MGFHSNGQTSLNNNRNLREKNRWKFESSGYPMPKSYINNEESIDKKALKSAENKKLIRIITEYSIVLGIVIATLYQVFLMF